MNYLLQVLFSDRDLDSEAPLADPSITVESLRSAVIGWPMNDGGNWVLAGPSAMEFMADHWLGRIYEIGQCWLVHE